MPVAIPLLRSGLLPSALFFSIGALALGGCKPAPEAITVPVSSWPGYEYVHLAAHSGLGAAQGLDITVTEYPDPQAIVHAYLRAELDLAQLTTVEAVDICSRAPDRCPVVVLVLDESRGGDQLAARLGIDSIAELRGQRVGVTHSTLGPYVLSRALERAGLSLADVQVRNMALAAMPDALAQGKVDAVAFFPPYSDYAARQGKSRPLFDSRAIPGEIFDVLVVSPAALEARGPALVRLLRAWQAAHDLARSQPAEARAVMARREGLSPEEFAAAERGLVYFSLREQLPMLAPGGTLARNLEAVQNVQQQLRLVNPGSPLPRVSDGLLREALR